MLGRKPGGLGLCCTSPTFSRVCAHFNQSNFHESKQISLKISSLVVTCHAYSKTGVTLQHNCSRTKYPAVIKKYAAWCVGGACPQSIDPSENLAVKRAISASFSRRRVAFGRMLRMKLSKLQYFCLQLS